MVLKRGRTAPIEPIEIELTPNTSNAAAPAHVDPELDQSTIAARDAVADSMLRSAEQRMERRVQRDGRRLERRRQRASLMLTTRIVLAGLLGVGVVFLASRAFDEVVPELFVPTVAAVAVALLVRRLRFAFRLVGAFVAVSAGTGITGLIAGTGPGALVGNLIDGPDRLLTTEWPSPLDAGVVMFLALCGGAVTATASDLAGRTRFHTAPLAAIGIGVIGALSVAAPTRPSVWLLAAMAIVGFVLLLARPGDDPRTRFRVLAGERSLLATAAAIAVAAVLIALAISWVDRSDPRRDVTPEQSLPLLFPVQQMIALRNVEPPLPMFRITDRSTLAGPSMPTRWRLSALDQYDGQRWLPTLTLRPIGSRLDDRSAAGNITPPITYEVEALTDDLSLIPLPGNPLEFRADDGVQIETDPRRTVVLLSDPPEPGLTATVTAAVAPASADVGAFDIANRQVDNTAATFNDTARDLAGRGTVLEQLRRIETTMQDEWLLDSSAPGGLQLALMNTFVDDTHRGTREQFVSAFVFFARSLGIDARIATGFIVDPSELGSPLTLSSDQATVWPEVQVEGAGWLAFEPVPTQETTQPDQELAPPSQQSPAAAQPPIEPPNERADESLPPPDEEIDDAIQSTVRIWLVRGAIGGGAVVLPVLLALGTIVLVKYQRRRRRLRAPDPAARILGAWANATDSLVDAGLTISDSWTDDRIAAQATALAPTLPHDMRRLAAAATAMTFGRRETGVVLVDDAIATSRSIDDAIRSERSRWQRIRWRLSLRSLRTSTRSPITA